MYHPPANTAAIAIAVDDCDADNDNADNDNADNDTKKIAVGKNGMMMTSMVDSMNKLISIKTVNNDDDNITVSNSSIGQRLLSVGSRRHSQRTKKSAAEQRGGVCSFNSLRMAD